MHITLLPAAGGRWLLVLAARCHLRMTHEALQLGLAR